MGSTQAFFYPRRPPTLALSLGLPPSVRNLLATSAARTAAAPADCAAAAPAVRGSLSLAPSLSRSPFPMADPAAASLPGGVPWRPRAAAADPGRRRTLETEEELVSRQSGVPAHASSSRRPWAAKPSPAPSDPRAGGHGGGGALSRVRRPARAALRGRCVGALPTPLRPPSGGAEDGVGDTTFGSDAEGPRRPDGVCVEANARSERRGHPSSLSFGWQDEDTGRPGDATVRARSHQVGLMTFDEMAEEDRPEVRARRSCSALTLP